MGTFAGTVDFDPSKKKLNLTNAGGMDVYVAKLNSAGALIWAASMGRTDHDGHRGDMTVDAAGNVYVTAEVGAGATFGSFTLTDGGTALAKHSQRLVRNGRFDPRDIVRPQRAGRSRGRPRDRSRQ